MAANPFALSFSGSGYVTLPSSVSTTGSMSVFLQFNLSNLNDQWFFTYGFGTGWGISMGFYTGKLYIGVVVNGVQTNIQPASNTISINQWYRLGIVYNDGKYAKVYLNGVEILSNSFSQTGLRHSGTSCIGADSSTGSYAHNLTGMMDEVSIWNKALSLSEIRWYDNKTLNGNENGLIAYYRCDQGSGVSLLDSTANGYNGTFSASGVSWTSSTPLILTKKYLIQDGNNIATTNGTALTAIGTAPVTQSMFDNYGQTDISLLTGSSVASSTSNTPKVLLWADTTSSNFSPTSTVTEVPIGRVIVQNSDYNLASYQSVAGFNLTSNVTGSGVVKVVVSSDSGSTWKTWDGVNNVWTNIDISTPNNVKTSGMSPATLNARTSSDISNLLGSSITLRFAYYLEQNASTDSANIDSLAIIVNMKGSWDMAVSNTDFKYGYPLNNDLRVTILTSGDYKINYQG